MAVHQTYLTYLHFPTPEWEKMATAVALGAGFILLGSSLTKRLRTAGGPEAHIVPAERVSWFGFFDLFVEGFVKFYDSILGSHNREHLPFVGSVFLFILTANLLGLVPGMPALTTTVWVNVGMALVVFIYFNWHGIKAHGLWGYLKHFGGPLWWLAWFMFPLEVFSTVLRILTLNLRLYWNITADHVVLGIFSDLLPAPTALPFYVLGTFVSFMQAFIFTTLTMVYILLATQHEEEDHDH